MTMSGVTGSEKKIVIRPELYSGIELYNPDGRLVGKYYEVKIIPKVRKGTLIIRLVR
jgi:hypothetical protein